MFRHGGSLTGLEIWGSLSFSFFFYRRSSPRGVAFWLLVPSMNSLLISWIGRQARDNLLVKPWKAVNAMHCLSGTPILISFPFTAFQKLLSSVMIAAAHSYVPDRWGCTAAQACPGQNSDTEDGSRTRGRTRSRFDSMRWMVLDPGWVWNFRLTDPDEGHGGRAFPNASPLTFTEALPNP
jgi:hypothetical protein